MAGTGLEEAHLRAHPHGHRPIGGGLLLGDDDNTAAVVNCQMTGLLGACGKIAHHRGCERDQPAHRRVKMCEPEHFQRQRKPVTLQPLYVTTAHQAVQHAVKLVRGFAYGLGNLDLRQPAIRAGEKLENVQTLVEGGGAISFAVVFGHLASVAFCRIAWREMHFLNTVAARCPFAQACLTLHEYRVYI
ncbi:hypothetical protein QE432_000393 [Agrobacterium sp. SORGH_AS 745]|nr:hypothetical protein [Agrobacterium sp. SORGH_AS_0745]